MAIERDRWNGEVGLESETEREGKRERRRGVKVLYGVLSGSCIQAAVISGHPLCCGQLYTPDFHSE